LSDFGERTSIWWPGKSALLRPPPSWTRAAFCLRHRSRRTVAFPDELVPELRWHLERFAEPGEGGLVFVGPKGAPLRRSNFRPIWNAARIKAGAPELHFHDLRHVGGTLAAATGASLKELMARLGHSSTRAALIYQHASRDRDQAIARALGGLVQQVRTTRGDDLGEGRQDA